MKEEGPKIRLGQWQNIWKGDHNLNKEETRKERSIEEDKYIYYGTKHARSGTSDTNKREKMGYII
jgi:hypothetical protein